MRQSSTPEIRLALERRLGPAKDAADCEIRFNCPKCRHSDHRLYVNPAKVRTDFYTGAQRVGWFLCFQCHWKGPLSFLFKSLGIEVADTVPDLSDLRERLVSRTQVEEGVGLLHFPDAVPVLVNDLARTFLLGRGMTERQIIDSGVFVRYREDYRRIYFPEFNLNGDITYCVSRRYLDGDSWPKYMSAGSRQQRGIYRLAEATPGAEITLVEGPMDALAVWDNVGALYGTYISDRQLEMLTRVSDRFLIALDGDAHNFAGYLGGRLHDLGKQVRVAMLPRDQDPSSLGTQFGEYCEAAVPLNQAELLRLRMK